MKGLLVSCREHPEQMSELHLFTALLQFNLTHSPKRIKFSAASYLLLEIPHFWERGSGSFEQTLHMRDAKQLNPQMPLQLLLSHIRTPSELFQKVAMCDFDPMQQHESPYLDSVDFPVGAAMKLDTQTLMPVIDHPGTAFAHFFSCSTHLLRTI